MTESSFEDIPGTTLFDGRMSRIGYHLNMFCMSLIKVENRAAFKPDLDSRTGFRRAEWQKC